MSGTKPRYPFAALGGEFAPVLLVAGDCGSVATGIGPLSLECSLGMVGRLGPDGTSSVVEGDVDCVASHGASREVGMSCGGFNQAGGSSGSRSGLGELRCLLISVRNSGPLVSICRRVQSRLLSIVLRSIRRSAKSMFCPDTSSDP